MEKKEGDSWFLTKRGDIVKMKHAIEIRGSFRILGYRLEEKNNFFTNPMQSSKLLIDSSKGDVCSDLCTHSLKEITAKLLCLKSQENFVFMPLIHSMENLN